ncbi:PQQ-binding-like beta-propeller repeat protein [Stieleria sp. TO1_6]|uniref:outer membrane protein assembly factor BamB family protein n=1 Tax=Stieleria tagensis TaxID=2956795 RepID=UPI00209ABBD4|nr:PQQ-binding-like beta-propeller repeat protein [Stieleria tagensis]MCO8124032.1 PQQ-binding-like beta-propeller repeat protein [Stieleria tagensis]
MYGKSIRFSLLWLLISVTPLAVAADPGGAEDSANAANWPQFRGSDSDGVAASSHPMRWSETENVDWSIDVDGEGWSCPVVWGDNVFLTTAVPIPTDGDAANTDPQEYQSGSAGRRQELTRLNYRWDVVCIDANDGTENWRQTAHTGHPTIPRHSSNTYATETPLTDGQRVYAYFGMTGLYCYDMQGRLQWSKNLGSYEMRAGWGTASSPTLHDGKLFLQIDNDDQSFIVAIDAATGNEIWRADRDEKSNYSSPIIWQNSQRDELIAGGSVCRSYDPMTGKLLWQLEMEKGRSSATPLAVEDRLYVGTELRNRGGDDDGGGYLFCIRPGGSGDLSTPPDQATNPAVLWKQERSGIQMASPVLCQGYLYLPERRSGMVHCLDAATGESVYSTRVPGARAFWASPWASGEQVYCVDTSGTTHVIAAGPKFNVVAKNEIDELTWSTPAIANGAIYFRTASKLYRISN